MYPSSQRPQAVHHNGGEKEEDHTKGSKTIDEEEGGVLGSGNSVDDLFSEIVDDVSLEFVIVSSEVVDSEDVD